MLKKETFFIREKEQIQILSVAARQEITDIITALGPCSATEIARNLGKPIDGLYYHLRALVDAGLVVAAGTRKTNRRDESLYDLPIAVKNYRIMYDPADPENARAVNHVVKGMSTIAAKDFAAGFVQGIAECEGVDQNIWAARMLGWLTPEEKNEVRDLLARLHSLTNQPKAPGRVHLQALTFIWAPARPLPARREVKK